MNIWTTVSDPGAMTVVFREELDATLSINNDDELIIRFGDEEPLFEPLWAPGDEQDEDDK